jgi:hypothetical protein
VHRSRRVISAKRPMLSASRPVWLERRWPFADRFAQADGEGDRPEETAELIADPLSRLHSSLCGQARRNPSFRGLSRHPRGEIVGGVPLLMAVRGE